MQDQSTFWRGKNVLITGAGGFIGSHLVEKLTSSGANVKAFIRYNSRGDPGLLSMLPKAILEKIQMIAGDLRDLPALVSASENVEVIFHLGALIAIPYSYLHPLEVVESNILGTVNVLLASRENKVARIVHTSSSEVYGSAQKVPIDETHPLQGQSPYSASKIGADKLAESFYYAFNLPVVILRPFNTYGPRQSARAVIPSIIIQALTQKEIHLGNMETYRDFTYISDTVEGFLCAGQRSDIEGKTINLGVGREIQIRVLLEKIFSILGKQVPIEVEQERLRPLKSEVMRLLSDNRLAGQILDWKPKVDLTEGLSKTIEWIASHKDHYDATKYQV